MSAATSPGPWALFIHPDWPMIDAPRTVWSILDADGKEICIEGAGYSPGDPHILKAAPELLQALESMLHEWNEHGDLSLGTCLIAAAAVKQAKGKS